MENWKPQTLQVGIENGAATLENNLAGPQNANLRVTIKPINFETTQTSVNWQMDKQSVVQSYNGILTSHKKEGSTDLCYSMDEPQ